MVFKEGPNSIDEISLVEDHKCDHLLREFISSNIIHTSTTNQSALNETTSLLNQYIKQGFHEDPDTFDLQGKSLTDVIMISLELKAPHSLIEVSSMY